ncbi:hypothetical protein OR1_03102 [Geobacter sp. OR-1]|uniref:peptidoglycan-binding domain-containing protein n=1 Tax=Geobacter sp. OR-1 TaxID=1266765 RepID=UPI0005434B61|nr:hypothetical protein [Geobacter sp. OR-1]GAM10805.1 hypothetical protein OR1_03102 [Geobacter sp. OR-1]
MKIFLIIAISLTLFAPSYAATDCANLPTVEQFKKSSSNMDTKKIQLCLSTAGFYAGKIDGLKGPLTISALTKYHAKRAGTPKKPGTTK